MYAIKYWRLPELIGYQFVIYLWSSKLAKAWHDYGSHRLLFFGRENIPKSKRLVAGAGHEGLPVRASCQIEHSVRVAGQ